jgi:hypothetical protein
MPHSQNNQVTVADTVADDIGLGRQNFAQRTIANSPPAIKEICEAIAGCDDFSCDLRGGARIELPYVLADGLKVDQSRLSPNNSGQRI